MYQPAWLVMCCFRNYEIRVSVSVPSCMYKLRMKQNCIIVVLVILERILFCWKADVSI